jgi:CHAD domain-containing protein
MSIDHTEIEWQFDAADLDVVRRWLESHASADGASADGVTVRAGGVRRQVDTYFDTADWRIYHAGYALRVRRLDSQSEATLKSLAPAGQGARHRREISEDLDDTGARARALDLLNHAPGDVGRRVKALAGTQPVRKLFELRTERNLYTLLIHGKPGGEIALDETLIVAQPRGREAHLRRVEVEVPDDSTTELRAFVDALRQDCELRRAVATKFESGLLAQRLVPDPSPHFGPTSVDAGSTAGELALATVRKQFRAFLTREPGVRLDEDIEDIHQMRLSARSLRAALKVFEKVLPSQIADTNEDIKWMGDLLGEVRDLDVQMQWLASDGQQSGVGEQKPAKPEVVDTGVEPAQGRANGTYEKVSRVVQARGGTEQVVADTPAQLPAVEIINAQVQLVGLEVLHDLLAVKRKTAHANLIRAMDTPRYEHFKSRVATLLRHPPKAPAKAGRSAYAVVPGLLKRFNRRAHKWGDTLGTNAMPKDYHTLRIKLKSLRYGLEFVKPLYGKPAKRMLKRIEALTDMLGEYHDMQVASQQFHAWRDDPARSLVPDALTMLDKLAWRSTARADELKAQFSELYADLSGKDWRRLREVMKKKK